ncbi:MAG: GNAT family N-acetyltransferase [Pseudoflavonifractor sp.]|nr:GNAT family N-acetyltransferase [Pseudoflavonifractor sp.]
MKHLGTKYLETTRLVLRPFTTEDAPAMFHNWASDEEVTKYLMWPAHKDVSVSQTVLETWTSNYSQKDYYQWAIVFKKYGSEPIGCIGVNNTIDDIIQMAHIGYCIGQKWWHHGITPEALECIMTFLFDQIGVQRIESRHDPRNPNSGAVMKKCGMKYEGTLRQSDWNNQGVCDACYYAMLSSER